jgi:hypothetical protein
MIYRSSWNAGLNQHVDQRDLETQRDNALKFITLWENVPYIVAPVACF